MGVDRWREAWLTGRTAFHRPEVHEDLIAHHEEVLGTFDGAWDRAALVALAPTVRPDYVEVLRRLLRPSARMLLQTFGCDRPPDSGPPYRVTGSEVERLFAGADARMLGDGEGRTPGPEGWPTITHRIRMEASSSHFDAALR